MKHWGGKKQTIDVCVLWFRVYSTDEYKGETLHYELALSRLVSFIFHTYQRSPINTYVC